MIYVAAILPIIVGGGLLAVDGARLFNLQTLLQKGADSLALAAAKELDGHPDALTRADLALANLVDNKHTFGAGGLTNMTMGNITRRYLHGLPANDSQPIDGSYVTTDPAIARFVEVTINPVNLNTIFPISFFTSTGTVTSQASAVAGFNQVVCEFTPLFICNPFEGTGESILDVVNDPAKKRRLINLKQHGGESSQYSPGNYGFLQPLQNPGADALRDMIGMSNPPACFVQNGVSLRPGFVATVRDAMNVRFNLYNGPMNSVKSDPRFRPAQNVRKGYTGAECNPVLDEDQIQNRKLPRDNCFELGSCPHMGGRMGDGEWDFDGYWEANFGHLGIPPPTDDTGSPFQCGGTGDPCVNPPSRYQIYRREISAGLLDTASLGGEVGSPQCNPPATNDNPDRRILYGAVLNCQELGIDGGAAGPYPAEAFVQFFVTEAMEVGPEDDIFVEIVDVFEPGGGGGGVVRDDVQLYR